MPVSDRSATIESLKELAAQFTDERDWNQFHSAKELAIGLVTEAAELLQHFRFKTDGQIKKLIDGRNRAKVEDEIADVLFLLLRLSTNIQCDLAGSLGRKLAKDSRHYPVKWARGKNLKYNER
jgi:NTP pyrophosphatase (non-canonical NTP hydrolase)